MYLLKIINAKLAQADGTVIESDLAVDSLGKIERIDNQLNGPARKTLDANGLTLLPGVIDPQVHFREPGATHKEDLGSGSRSAPDSRSPPAGWSAAAAVGAGRRGRRRPS